MDMWQIDQDLGYVLFNQECFLVFHNLIHLELNYNDYMTWHLEFEMLMHCPKLQTFSAQKILPMKGSTFKIWSCVQFALECISSQLKKCTILNYEGKECELRFAKYIIQNSRALHTMSISNLTISYTNSSNCARQAWNATKNGQMPKEFYNMQTFI